MWRKMLWLVVLLVAVVSAPVAAQDMSDPAASMPADAPIYLELRVDEAAITDFEALADFLLTLSDNADAPAALLSSQVSPTALVQLAFPQATFEDDIAPWVSDRVGLVLFPEPGEEATLEQMVLVIPAADPAAMTASLPTLTADMSLISSGGVTEIYDPGLENYQLVTTPDAVLLGSPVELETILSVRGGEVAALVDAASYQRIRTELPDATATMVVNAGWVRAGIGESEVRSVNEIFEVALRLHPAESEMETALLETAWIDGFGAVMTLDGNRLEVTTVTTVDATYAAPTLATAGAGSVLVPLMPAETVFFISSYDTNVVGSAFAGLALMGPAIGNVFDNIITQLEGGEVPPTPTPPPTPSVDERIAEAQPFIRQAEDLMGANIEEIVQLTEGEWAIAVFEGYDALLFGQPSNGLGFALWVQTSDADRLLELMGNGISNGLAMVNTPLDSRTETVNRSEVTYLSDSSMGDLIAYGKLTDDVVFVTAGGVAPIITQAALGDGVLPQSDRYPSDMIDSFGDGGEMLIYADFGTLANIAGDPALSVIESLTVWIDLEADGVFRTHTDIILAVEASAE